MIEFEEQEMKNIIINQIMIPSLQELYKVDFDNIRLGVSERNICARLAHHMENILRKYDKEMKYFVDVEYNRMGNGDVKSYENSEKKPVKMVSDLLIQSRGLPRNLLAVEMKRSGNRQNVDSDKRRLVSLVTPSSPETLHNCVHDTLVGAFITYSENSVNVLLYENVNGHGEMTDEMNFICIKEGEKTQLIYNPF